MAKRGKPPKYKSVDQLAEAIADYFDDCEERGAPMTMSGLVRSLGFRSRSSLRDYSKRNDGCNEFAHSLARARLRIEADLNERLVDGRGDVYSIMFTLRQNFGWREK